MRNSKPVGVDGTKCQNWGVGVAKIVPNDCEVVGGLPVNLYQTTR